MLACTGFANFARDVANGANFAIVGDTIYVLLFYDIFAVKFGQVIKSWY